jgi:hypothetical protein
LLDQPVDGFSDCFAARVYRAPHFGLELLAHGGSKWSPWSSVRINAATVVPFSTGRHVGVDATGS